MHAMQCVSVSAFTVDDARAEGRRGSSKGAHFCRFFNVGGFLFIDTNNYDYTLIEYN